MSGRCKACDDGLDSFDDPVLCRRCIAQSTLGEELESPEIDEFERIVNVEETPAFEDFPDEEDFHNE